MATGNRIIRFLNLMIGSKDMIEFMEETDTALASLLTNLSLIDGETQINDGSIPPEKLDTVVIPALANDGFALTYNYASNKFELIDLRIVDGDNIIAASIPPAKLLAVAAPSAGETSFVLTYNHAASKFEWQDMSAVVGSDTYQVKWNAGDTFEYLESKFPNPTTSTGDEVLKINAAGDAYELGPIISGLTSAITENTILNVMLTGNDTTGNGEFSTPFYSLAGVIAYLKNTWINTDAQVTILFAAGVWPDLPTCTINHPCANNIVIAGAAADSSVLNFYGEGIVVEGVNIKDIYNLVLNGSSILNYSGLTYKHGAHFNGFNIHLAGWKTCLDLSDCTVNCDTVYMDNSATAVKADNTNGTLIGLHITDTATGGFISRNSAIDATGSTMIGGTNGFMAEENSFINATGVTCTAATPYSPALNTEGSIRSFIYQP